MLRLLSSNEECFKEGDFRIKVFNLFDIVLSADLYPQLKIKIKQQTYEKENKLKDAVPQGEAELATVILSLNSMEGIFLFP